MEKEDNDCSAIRDKRQKMEILFLAVDVMTQTPTIALPSWMGRRRRRRASRKIIQGVETVRCITHLASCPANFQAPFYLANYGGTWIALNLSCWQECCRSCSIFILTCTWGMTNLNITPWSPPNPTLCSFCISCSFQPWTSLWRQIKFEGFGKLKLFSF